MQKQESWAKRLFHFKGGHNQSRLASNEYPLYQRWFLDGVSEPTRSASASWRRQVAQAPNGAWAFNHNCGFPISDVGGYPRLWIKHWMHRHMACWKSTCGLAHASQYPVDHSARVSVYLRSRKNDRRAEPSHRSGQCFDSPRCARLGEEIEDVLRSRRSSRRSVCGGPCFPSWGSYEEVPTV